MTRCPAPDCGWQAIAPGPAAARDQLAEHLVEAHARTVDADVPEGMVQIKPGPDADWVTVTPEQARRIQAEYHE